MESWLFGYNGQVNRWQDDNLNRLLPCEDGMKMHAFVLMKMFETYESRRSLAKLLQYLTRFNEAKVVGTTPS
jgi:hypothetical protein